MVWNNGLKHGLERKKIPRAGILRVNVGETKGIRQRTRLFDKVQISRLKFTPKTLHQHHVVMTVNWLITSLAW